MNLCYKIVPNYFVAIFLLALIIKIILFPLGIKQQKNMQKNVSRPDVMKSLVSAAESLWILQKQSASMPDVAW